MKPGTTLLLLAAMTGCQMTPAADPRPLGTASAPARRPAKLVGVGSSQVVPEVIVVTSSATCAGGRDDDIAESVADDAKLLEAVLLSRVGREHFKVLVAPTPLALKQAIASVDSQRGLWLIYTGHGRVEPAPARKPGDAPAPLGVGLRSSLCLGTRSSSDGSNSNPAASRVTPLDVSELLQWIDEKGFRWANLVLNSCESAHVDVSRLRHPISVISASPEQLDGSVAQGSQTAPTSQAPHATRLVQAIGAAIEQGAKLDTNCDGWVSDRELFDAARAQLADMIILREQSFLMPRLRRQATLPLPLYGVESNSACEQALKNLELDSELAELLSLQLNPAARLPAHATDFFFLDNADVHRACVLFSERRVATDGLDAARQQRLETCGLLLDNGLSPYPLATMPDSSQANAPGKLPDEVSRVAKVMRFAEVFHIHWEREWIHVDRLRDERRMASRQGQLQPGDVPRRKQLLSRWQSGGELVRYTHLVPLDTSIPAARREATVCPEFEGQCFYQMP